MHKHSVELREKAKTQGVIHNGMQDGIKEAPDDLQEALNSLSHISTELYGNA